MSVTMAFETYFRIIYNTSKNRKINSPTHIDWKMTKYTKTKNGCYFFSKSQEMGLHDVINIICKTNLRNAPLKYIFLDGNKDIQLESCQLSVPLQSCWLQGCEAAWTRPRSPRRQHTPAFLSC